MRFKAEQASIYIRIVALISLALGLSDAARLLGVQLGNTSPIAAMGLSAFIWLAIFALARLFAAVGLWIKASWGGVLLVGATGVELALYLSGSRDVQMTMLGFVVRVILLASIALILLLGFRMKRAAAHD
jgi:hypothetical protein